MDWSKVDAGLAAALADGASGRYVVFVHLDPDASARGLTDLGVEAVGDGSIRTATLSAEDVDRLTDQVWVTLLRLSRTLRVFDRT